MAPAQSITTPSRRGRRPARDAAEPVLTEFEAREGLAASRRATLELVAGVGEEDLERAHSPLMSPLVWDLGHIAAYEDLWLVHRHTGAPLLRPELADLYDAFETPRPRRADLPILDTGEAHEYLDAVRQRTQAAIASHGVGSGELHELVIRHEYQHNETMLQTLTLARLARLGLARAPRPPAQDGPGCDGLELVEVPGGRFQLGATSAGFAYDNERPRHTVELAPFRLGRTPVTNAAWLEWMRRGGYRRREHWTASGWEHRLAAGLEHPGGWMPVPEEQTGYRQWRMGGWAPLALEDPVEHVSWFEADAFARSHGARLPTELEWERAATHDADGIARDRPWGAQTACRGRANLREQGVAGTAPAGAFADGAAPCGARGLLGDVWEWTASDFCGYPGFRAHPYREYSEVFFGSRYKVLRGGSWATAQRLATPTFRNWDLPERRQIFAGLRLARNA